MKTISFTLSQNSVKNAMNEIKKYRDDLKRKNEIFVTRLAKEGLSIVQSTMESIPEEVKGSYYTELIMDNKGENIKGAAIRLTGEKVLFVEFSAGIAYGTPQGGYPLESGKKYGVGTYPGQTHAESPYGWWYVDESGNKHHSYGNRAYMPMYHAEQAIIFSIRKIAQEVFG